MDGVETGRLLLRPWAAGDLDDLAAILADPEVSRYPLGRPLTREESERFLVRQMERWETQGLCMWAADCRADGRLMGFIGLAVPTWLPMVLPAVEVGWRLHPSYRGRGLATEGARATLRYGFEELGLDRILSMFVVENVASGRVMDKLGMRHILTTEDPTSGAELHVREITRDEWRAAADADWEA